VDDAIQRMRDLALDLRPAILDDLGLEAALRWYVAREAGRAGLAFRLDVGSIGTRLAPALETACFRLVQEALTNVVRHGQAEAVEVKLDASEGEVRVSISDDGKGFDVRAARRRATAGGSQGLLIMEERVSLAGGKLEIRSGREADHRRRAHSDPGSAAMTKLRILLADDHKLVRAGLRVLLERIADLEVVGESADGQDALRQIAELRPDVALVDVSMPGLNGIETAARVAREHPATRVLIVSMHLDEEYVHRALSAGAAGYLLKTSELQELEIAVRAVGRARPG